MLEELTGTEIYGQISAMVFEQHKSARTELEKLQAQNVPAEAPKPEADGENQETHKVSLKK